MANISRLDRNMLRVLKLKSTDQTYKASEFGTCVLTTVFRFTTERLRSKSQL